VTACFYLLRGEIAALVYLIMLLLWRMCEGGELTYLCSINPSNPGVEGRLDSWTVSSFGVTPLAPLDDAFMLIGGSSGSLFDASSLTGTRDAGAGDELCTTIAGVEEVSGFLGWVRSEF